MIKLRVCLIALVGAPIVASIACYGPTAVTLDLSTDVGCDPVPTTSIYTELAPTAAPVAVATQCRRTADGADLGSLALVPSGDRDGRATLRAVLARGVDPSKCDVQKDSCIVATRSFSFVKHAALHLPIRLLGECFGKTCAAGFTCGPGGKCVSDTVVCGGGECRLPSEAPVADAGPAPPEAGTPEAGGGPSPPPCTGPTGDGTLVTLNGPMPDALEAAHGAGVFYYLDPLTKSSAPEIKMVSATGVSGSVLQLPPGAQLIALKARGGAWGALSSKLVGPTVRAAVDSKRPAVVLGDVSPDSYTDLAWSSDTNTAYVSWPGGVAQLVDQQPPSKLAAIGGSRVAADDNAVYVATQSAVVALSLKDGGLLGKHLFLAEGTNPVSFAYLQGRVFASGVDASGRRIVLLDGAQPPQAVASPLADVVSFDVDSNRNVYWTDGHAIWRAAAVDPVAANDPVPTVVFTATDGSVIDHLAVGEGCIYFWNEAAKATSSALRVIPNPP